MGSLPAARQYPSTGSYLPIVSGFHCECICGSAKAMSKLETFNAKWNEDAELRVVQNSSGIPQLQKFDDYWIHAFARTSLKLRRLDKAH